MVEAEEELKSLLLEVREESEKSDLKLNIQKLRSWHPVPSLHEKKEKWKLSNFIFFGSKINAVTAVRKLKDICSLEEKPLQP